MPLRLSAAPPRVGRPCNGHACGSQASPGFSKGWRAVRLTVNGEDRVFEALTDVAGLVAALGLNPRKVAVERNLAIVPRSAYGSTPLADGDRIEIVHFIGGG